MVTAYVTEQCKPMKCLCDATVRHDKDGLAAIGVVVQNHNGRVLDRHGRVIGKGYSTEAAEIEALHEACSALADEDGVQHVKLYSDSIPALKHHDCIERFGDDFEYMTFDHIPRDMNEGAHIVADRQLTPNKSRTNVQQIVENVDKSHKYSVSN